MTIRYLLVTIDDAKPLGPQLMGARIRGVPWKILRELCGGFSVRHLQELRGGSLFCERQAARFGVTVRSYWEEAGVAGLFGGGITGGRNEPRPEPPEVNSAEILENERRQRMAAAAAIGRDDTILTEYAMATTVPTTLKRQLGA